MKILFFSDLHLGKKVSNSQLLALDKMVIEKVCEEALEHKVDKIVFGGDLFHNRSEESPKALQMARQMFSQLNTYGIPIVAILGNHDIYYNNRKDVNYYRIFDGLFENITFVHNFYSDEECLYVGWMQDKKDWEMYQKLSPNYKWIFGHFEFKNVQLERNYYSNFGYENDNREAYIFSGHFHNRVISNRLHYVGSPYPHDWHGKNRDDYGCVIVDTTEEKIEYVNFHLFYFYEFSLKNLMGMLEKNEEEVRKQFKNNEVRVIVDVMVDPVKLSQIRTQLNSYSPRTLIIENEMLYKPEAVSVEPDKVILKSPQEFISDYIKDLQIKDDQKQRITEKIESILK